MCTIDQVIKYEREQRKAKRWMIFDGVVQADDGRARHVQIKSHGLFNQILRVDGPVNREAGHTLRTVRALHDHLRNTINGKG